jgi:cardiolipin synthase
MDTAMFTIPNLVTLLRIALTPLIIWLLATGHYLSGGWTFGAAAFTDIVDGFLARHFSSTSKTGLYLDPIADKILLSSVFIGLAAVRAIDRWVVYLVFGRDLWILLLGGIALRFTSFRDLKPNVWGKINTLVQIAAVIVVMAANAFFDSTLTILGGFLMYLVAAFAVVSGLLYTLRGVNWLRKGNIKAVHV